MQLITFTGIQASGKSTFYKHYFFDTHVRINLDMLKTRHRETLLFSACLDSKTNCVIDNTNPLISDRARYIVPAKKKGFEIIGYFFITDIDQALHRNVSRPKPIPDKGIFATLKKLVPPTFSEGYDHLYNVLIDIPGHFLVNQVPRNPTV